MNVARARRVNHVSLRDTCSCIHLLEVASRNLMSHVYRNVASDIATNCMVGVQRDIHYAGLDKRRSRHAIPSDPLLGAGPRTDGGASRWHPRQCARTAGHRRR
ncbi:hypothetical protein SMG44B_30072 [Stenotrophomonas maltophilia]